MPTPRRTHLRVRPSVGPVFTGLRAVKTGTAPCFRGSRSARYILTIAIQSKWNRSRKKEAMRTITITDDRIVMPEIRWFLRMQAVGFICRYSFFCFLVFFGWIVKIWLFECNYFGFLSLFFYLWLSLCFFILSKPGQKFFLSLENVFLQEELSLVLVNMTLFAEIHPFQCQSGSWLLPTPLCISAINGCPNMPI